MHKSTFFNDQHNMVPNDPNNYSSSFPSGFSNPYPVSYHHPSVYDTYKSSFDISFPQHSLYSTGHHSHQVGQVYTTESYPPAFLPSTSSSNSSSESSPMVSPALLPRRIPSSGGLGDQFMLDQQSPSSSSSSNNNCNNCDNCNNCSNVNGNNTKVKRKSSRASIRSNRNSILLDPIVEEELPYNNSYFINNMP